MFLRSVLLLISALLVNACAVERVVTEPASVAQKRLDPGDGVIVFLKNGKSYRGFVKETDDKQLVLRDGSYAWTDIQSVKYREIDPVRSTAASLGTYWLVGLIGVVLFIAML